MTHLNAAERVGAVQEGALLQRLGALCAVQARPLRVPPHRLALAATQRARQQQRERLGARTTITNKTLDLLEVKVEHACVTTEELSWPKSSWVSAQVSPGAPQPGH